MRAEAAHGERILCRAVTPPDRHRLRLLAAALLAGCGGEIEVPESDTTAHRGAELFNQRCSGCHTLRRRRTPTARSRPSQLQGGERTNGPNFNVRQESRDDVLFAIRNGGFSGAIMPANVVVGGEAHEVSPTSSPSTRARAS